MANGGAGDGEWYLSDGLERVGPGTLDELKSALRNEIDPLKFQVWRDGLKGWTPVSEASEFAEFRGSVSPSVELPRPMLQNENSRGARKASITALLEEADQGRIRDELATFFGPHAEDYLGTYEKMLASTGRRRLSPRTLSWPVFLVSFAWFFYRKMYIYGAMLIFVPIIMSYLLGSAGGGSTALFSAMMAKGWYVQSGLNRILKADGLGLTGLERSDYLKRAGGVSLTAGAFAGFVYVAMLALFIYAQFVRHHVGS